MRTLKVEIFNTCLTIREPEDENYLTTLAAEVDARIQKMFGASQQISPLRAAIMVAYQLADEAKRAQGKRVGEQVYRS